jgi:hypothetical protein
MFLLILNNNFSLLVPDILSGRQQKEGEGRELVQGPMYKLSLQQRDRMDRLIN